MGRQKWNCKYCQAELEANVPLDDPKCVRYVDSIRVCKLCYEKVWDLLTDPNFLNDYRTMMYYFVEGQESKVRSYEMQKEVTK